MTTDELVDVLEDLLGDMKVSDLRSGTDYKPASKLSDASWGLLVRFIGGERPERGSTGHTAPSPATVRPQIDPIDRLLAEQDGPHYSESQQFKDVKLS